MVPVGERKPAAILSGRPSRSAAAWRIFSTVRLPVAETNRSGRAFSNAMTCASAFSYLCSRSNGEGGSDLTFGNWPSKAGTIARMRFIRGGWVERNANQGVKEELAK